MDVPPEAILALVASYLSGSVPYGLLVARAHGVDVTKVGSGNIGATNVARAVGRMYGMLVLVLDALKGLGPTLAVRTLWPARPELAAAAGLLAILGHVFPVWLRGRGGKGVATALGVFLALEPLATLAATTLFAAVYGLKRIVSIGSIAAATGLPIAMLVLDAPLANVLLGVAVWLLVVVRHRANISRLLHREEKSLP